VEGGRGLLNQVISVHGTKPDPMQTAMTQHTSRDGFCGVLVRQGQRRCSIMHTMVVCDARDCVNIILVGTDVPASLMDFFPLKIGQDTKQWFTYECAVKIT